MIENAEIFDFKDYVPYIQSAGIILSFSVAAFALWRSMRANRVSTYIDLVKSHRDIWSMPYKQDGLENVMSCNADDWTRPISDAELMFICYVINHISCSYELMKIDNLVNPEGLDVDIRTLFSLPIPRRVWDQTRHFRNKDFCKFVEKSLVGSIPKITKSASGSSGKN